MAQTNKTPAGKAGASRDKLASHSRDAFTLSTYRVQLLASRYAMPLEIAALIAALAFAGGAHG